MSLRVNGMKWEMHFTEGKLNKINNASHGDSTKCDAWHSRVDKIKWVLHVNGNWHSQMRGDTTKCMYNIMTKTGYNEMK